MVAATMLGGGGGPGERRSDQRKSCNEQGFHSNPRNLATAG
jgi:hypothetical protein